VVEYNSVIWSPSSVRDIKTVERVERRFTKRLPALRNVPYDKRLEGLYGESNVHVTDDVTWPRKVKVLYSVHGVGVTTKLYLTMFTYLLTYTIHGDLPAVPSRTTSAVIVGCCVGVCRHCIRSDNTRSQPDFVLSTQTDIPILHETQRSS